MGHSSATFIACEFSDNSAGCGGAVYGGLSDAPQFTDCVFIGNSSQSGGAVATDTSQPRFTRCTFADNQTPGDGGALLIFTWFGHKQENAGAVVELANCTLSGNSATGRGGGLCVLDRDVSLINTIIAHSPDGQSIYSQTDSALALVCCDIYGNAGGDWIAPFADQLGQNGNICADPRFCGPADPNRPYTLWSDSPCAEGQSPECGQIGAWPVGCDASAIADDGATRPASPRFDLGLSVRSIGVRSVAVNYRLPEAATAVCARLDISDVLGRCVKTLIAGPQSPGEHTIFWDGRGGDGRAAPSGVYWVGLSAGQQRATRRLVLLR